MTPTVWYDFVESHVIVDRHPHNRSCRWWQRGKVALQCDRLCNAQTFIDTIVSQKSPSLSYSYNGGTSCALFHGCSPLQAARLLQALDSGLSMVTHSVRCHFAMTDNNIYYKPWLLFLIYYDLLWFYMNVDDFLLIRKKMPLATMLLASECSF